MYDSILVLPQGSSLKCNVFAIPQLALERMHHCAVWLPLSVCFVSLSSCAKGSVRVDCCQGAVRISYSLPVLSILSFSLSPFLNTNFYSLLFCHFLDNVSHRFSPSGFWKPLVFSLMLHFFLFLLPSHCSPH